MWKLLLVPILSIFVFTPKSHTNQMSQKQFAEFADTASDDEYDAMIAKLDSIQSFKLAKNH